MEDNEFEEVTIISHTDRPHRVFSEKSIEKLKEQISLEIVKEISGTEDKTYSDDPRLAPGLRELEKLKQDHFGEGEGKIAPDQAIYFISRVAGESGQYLLGGQCFAVISNGHSSKQLLCDAGCSFVACWGDKLYVFSDWNSLEIFDVHTLQLESTAYDSYCLKSSRNLTFSTNSMYFLSNPTTICKISDDLKEENIKCYNYVQDFFVCPKTETITTLMEDDSQGFYIQRDFKKVYLDKKDEHSGFHILKKMYSDHFLVGETNGDQGTYHHLHLWTNGDLRPVTSCTLYTSTTSSIENIRLLAPRQGIN